MRDIVLSLVTGAVIGALFRWLQLPLPAPPVLAGVMGIVGIWLGGMLVQWLMR